MKFMKRILFFLSLSLLAFTACDNAQDEENNSVITTSLTGTWVTDLAESGKGGELIFNADGTGTLYGDDFSYNFDSKLDSLHISSQIQESVQITAYKIELQGDIMTWSFTDEEGYSEYYVWFKQGGEFNRKVADGRYDLFTDASASDTMGVYFFKGNTVDVYIIAWGQHLSGTFTHENGVLTMNFTEGECLSSQPDHISWFAPGLNPETLEPYGGYEWYDMNSLDEWASELYNDTKSLLNKVSFVLTSSNNGYGSVGRSGVIKKH